MLASGLRGRLHLHTQGVLTALSGDPGNLVALLIELSIKGLRILHFQNGIFAAVNSRAGRIGSCAIQQFLLALLDQLLLQGDLCSVVESIMHGLLTFRAFRLRVHQLRLGWVILLSNLFLDSLVSLELALCGCLLICQELLLSAALVANFLVDCWSKLALLFDRVFLLLSLLFKFVDALLFQLRESLNLSLSGYLALQFFL